MPRISSGASPRGRPSSATSASVGIVTIVTTPRLVVPRGSGVGTVATGVASAVAGGFTAVACMPNTSPVNDNANVTSFILGKAAQANLARVWLIVAIVATPAAPSSRRATFVSIPHPLPADATKWAR